MKFKYLYIIILILSLVGFANAAAPVANFTSNITVQSFYPMIVQFTGDSSNTPTTWNWSFGDGRWFNTTNTSLKNPIYQYAVAGKYTVNLTVNNTDGINTKSSAEYINLTSDNDNNLTSWLHMNGTNASTIFIGEKGVAWLTNGGSQISTNQPKYGGASGWFPSFLSSYISTPTSSAFNFGTGNFTIEFWMKVNTITSTNMHVFSKTNNPRTRGWGMDCTGGTDSGWDFWMGNDSGGQVFFNALIPNGTWTHIAIERQAGTIYLYVNGNLTNSSVGFNANYDTSDPVWIGRQQNNYFNGYIDEFRISTVARWKSNFTPPYNEYKGTLETIYPDVNLNSTFRYKTDPGGIAYLDNITTRNRTVQIQNITNTSYIVGQAYFNPLCSYATSVHLNTTYYSTGMTLLNYSIDNTYGTIEFNISKPTGFSPGTDRASILDFTIAYTNYTAVTVIPDYFGYGYLINGSTNNVYGIHNFLGTSPTYGDWNFTANFTADNLTPQTGTPVTFYATFNGSYPNRWYWSFGDGTFDDGINSTVSHTYTFGGLKTVSVVEYLWQDGSIADSKIKTNYINVIDTIPVADFTSVQTGGPGVPVTVQFTDISTNYPTTWYWDFGDGNNTFSVPIIQNPTHVYNVCGSFTVSLMAGNTAGYSLWENKTGYVTVACITPTPTPTPKDPNATSEKLATKMLDTQNILVMGVILIIIAGLSVFIANTFLHKSG